MLNTFKAGKPYKRGVEVIEGKDDRDRSRGCRRGVSTTMEGALWLQPVFLQRGIELTFCFPLFLVLSILSLTSLLPVSELVVDF